ncbi:MAG: AhpC/TSA family protein [Marinifilaceae bacterium]|nr:AhpC/TSA family protein [Marinifilaceae bacterium]
MNKFQVLLAFCLLFASCKNTGSTTDNSFAVKGELSELKKDLKITLFYTGENGENVIDTTTTKEGKFLFKGNISNAVQARIYYVSDEEVIDPVSKEKFYIMDAVNFFLSAGTTDIKGKRLRDGYASGTLVQNQYNDYLHSIKSLKQETDTLYKILRQKDELENTVDTKRNAGERIAQIGTQMNSITVKFISEHLDSYVSLFLLSDLRNQDLDDSIVSHLISSMSDRIKATDEWIKLNKKVEAAKAMAVGSKYIDFTKKDINGSSFTLSSIKGKYVILDFWGSWCGPCRASHPHLKEAYEKYKSEGLTIVGICNEKSQDIAACEESWKKAVKKDGMPWTQVLNNYDKETTDLVKVYAIEAFPTKILLNKEGEIFGRIVGGDPNILDEKLKELIGK